MPTKADYLNLNQAAYTTGATTPSPPPGWTVLQSQALPSGMQGIAFQNNTTHEIVMAFEGTNLANAIPNTGFQPSFFAGQIAADSAIANGTSPRANTDALNFAINMVNHAGGNPVYLTGHSLGGEEAEYVQSKIANAGLNVNGGAVFGAPGVPQLSGSFGNYPNFVNYIDYGDLVGGFVPTGGMHVGQIRVLVTSKTLVWS